MKEIMRSQKKKISQKSLNKHHKNSQRKQDIWPKIQQLMEKKSSQLVNNPQRVSEVLKLFMESPVPRNSKQKRTFIMGNSKKFIQNNNVSQKMIASQIDSQQSIDQLQQNSQFSFIPQHKNINNDASQKALNTSNFRESGCLSNKVQQQQQQQQPGQEVRISQFNLNKYQKELKKTNSSLDQDYNSIQMHFEGTASQKDQIKITDNFEQQDSILDGNQLQNKEGTDNEIVNRLQCNSFSPKTASFHTSSSQKRKRQSSSLPQQEILKGKNQYK